MFFFETHIRVPCGLLLSFCLLSLGGCSDSGSESGDTAASNSSGNSQAANAAANMAAPGLAGIEAAAGGEFGAAPESMEDYGGGDYDEGGSSGGGHGGAMAMTPGAMSPGAMSPGAMGPGAMTPGAMGPGAMTPGGDSGGEHAMSGGMGAAMGMDDLQGEYGDGSDSSYGSGNSQGYGSGMQPGGMPGGMAQGSQPADVSQWTDDDFVKAAEEKNPALLTAIGARADQSVGDPAFSALMTRVLNESSGVSSGGGASPFPGFGAPGAVPKGQATPYKPSGSTPPGGAFRQPAPEELFQKSALGEDFRLTQIQQPQPAVDSLEAMIGESLLGFVPQALGSPQGRGSNSPGAVSPGAVSPGGVSPGVMSPGGVQSGGPMGSEDGLEHAAGGGGMPSRGGLQQGGMQPGGTQFGGGMQGPPGGGLGGNGSQPPRSGNLSPEDLVAAITRSLVKSNTPQSWGLLRKIHNGEQPTPTSAEDAKASALIALLEAQDVDQNVAQEILKAATAEAISSPMSNDKTLRLLETSAAQTASHYFRLGTEAGKGPAGGISGGGPGGMGPGGMPPGGMGPGAMGPGGMAPGGMGPGAMGPGAMGPGAMGPGAMGPGGMAPGGMGAGMESGFGGGGEGEDYGDYDSGGFGSGSMARGQQPQGPPPPVRVSEALFPLLASVLWDSSTVDSLAAALQNAGSFEQARPLLPLAAAMPHDVIRRATFEVLKPQYKTGANDLISMGFFQGMMVDPGMVPVLKSLPRERPPRQASGPNVAAQPQATPESTWTEGTRQAVLSLRDRLRKAANDPDLAFDGATPLRLHRGAIPQKSIRLTSEGDIFKPLEGHSPSKTTYYYTSCSIAPTRATELNGILEHYEKRAKAFRRLSADQTMLWMDGMKTTSNGSRQSIDVVIEQIGGRSRGGGNYGGDYGGGGPPGGGGQGASVQYQIEVIVVEVQDPAAVPEGDKVTLD